MAQDQQINPFLPQRRSQQEADSLTYSEPVLPVTRTKPEQQVEAAVRLNLLIEFGHAAQAELAHQIQDKDTRQTAVLIARTVDYLAEVLDSIRDVRAKEAFEKSVLPQLVELHVRSQLGLSYTLADQLRRIISDPLRPEPAEVLGFWRRLLGR